MTTPISAEQTHVFPRMLDLSYPVVESGQGVWLELADGSKLRRVLGGSDGHLPGARSDGNR